MQADGPLYVPAYKALDDIVHSMSRQDDQHLKVYAQMLTHEKSFRYRIDSAGIHQDDSSRADANDRYDKQPDRQRPFDTLFEVIDTLVWALSESALEYTMLIFSGHGTGILEPRWSACHNRWVYEPDEGPSAYVQYCARREKEFFHKVLELADQKSLFLSAHQRTCVTVREITQLLDFLNQKMQKKIDIIGFDACHMGMLEIGFAVHDYAHYMVASQDCEEKDGWNYQYLGALCQNRMPHQVARGLVHAYAKKQKKREQQLFSLAAFDLATIPKVLGCFDHVCVAMLACLAECGADFHDILFGARIKNPRFCQIPMYADLIAFFTDLLNDLSLLETRSSVELLKISLLEVLEALEGMMICHVSGPACPAARGCSIYFPTAHVDTSYLNTTFAVRTRWLNFIKAFFVC